MKKIISIFLSVVLIMSLSVCAFAENDDATLKFNKDGKFKILHLTDCQDDYPANEDMISYIYKVLEEYEPDLVVLGGDNTVSAEEYKEASIEELVKPFIDTETYFTLVFGNHDHEQGYTNVELFDLFAKYGGEYFLGTNDVDPKDSSKAGTHFLPVYSSDGKKVAYGIYMFDSGSYAYDEDGNNLGYDSVEPYQIDWYKSVRDSYKQSDGSYLPSVVFQHIIVGDVYDYLYYKSAVDLGELGRTYYGNHYTFVPKTQNFTGFLNEPPCPGYYNYGQLDAMAEKGDVKAVFSGHDHMNSFDVEIKGVHVINTPSCSYTSYSSPLNKGSRLITLDEKTSSCETELITYNDLVLNDSDFAEKIDGSKVYSVFFNGFGDVLLALGKAFSIFGTLLDTIVK